MKAKDLEEGDVLNVNGYEYTIDEIRTIKIGGKWTGMNFVARRDGKLMVIEFDKNEVIQ